jgi:DNA-binding NarL/FixJ family response regulator
MSAIDLGQAAVERLAADTSRRGLTDSLAEFCRHPDVDRISLHAVDPRRGTFRVVGSAGSDILADGTELPLETSSQVLVPARGEVFRAGSFATCEDFDRPLDNLVLDMGYRSGCSIPLFMGSRPIAILGASSVRDDFDPEPVLEAMNEASLALTMALGRVEESRSRVVVCIDDELLAQGIARVIEKTAMVDVETYSSAEALAASGRSGRSGRGCEVVVCDVAFDGVQVDSFLASLRSGGTNSPVLVLASKDTPASRSLAQQGGAAAYLARSAGVDRLAAAIGGLMSGETDEFRPDAGGAGDEEPEIPKLTRQEARILNLLERGLRFKQIALELDISESTAKGYARNLFAKLGAHSRSEAVYIARNRGLLDLEPA